MINSKLLSVCMIVKNEEKNVPIFIPQFYEFADEIVINDTGSTDNTISLIKKLNDGRIKLFNSEWSAGFHFADARNMSLERATCRWCIHLDADDRVVLGEGKKIRKLIKKLPHWAIIMVSITSELPEMLGAKHEASSWSPRIHCNLPKLRFINRVHEGIEAIEGFKFYKSEIVVRHEGYKNVQDSINKNQRNLPLIEAELKENPEKFSLVFSIGNTYFNMMQLDKAIHYFHKIIDAKDKVSNDLYTHTMVLIAECLLLIGKQKNNEIGYAKEALKWAAKSITLKELNIPAYYILCRCFCLTGQFDSALQCCDYVLATPDYTSVCLFNNSAIKKECELMKNKIIRAMGGK